MGRPPFVKPWPLTDTTLLIIMVLVTHVADDHTVVDIVTLVVDIVKLLVKDHIDVFLEDATSVVENVG